MTWRDRMAVKNIVVTGGASGIGLAIAKAFAGEGHQVTIMGRNEERLKATGFDYLTADVTDEAALSAAITQCGPADIFIANAGAATTAPALKTSRAVWDEMLAVNLTSVYLCAREAIPPMIDKGWGRFIAIASTAAIKGYAYTGAYAAAKHGVLGWTRSLALELAKTGVTANAICPGFTDTPLIGNALAGITAKTGRSPEESLKAFTKSNPMGRLVSTHEVAGAALWLASEAAASVNGQAITIDGGETVS